MLIISVILSVILVSSFIPVSATVQEDIKKLENDIEKQQKKINTFQKIIDRFQSLINLAQSRIDEKLALLNELKYENGELESIKIKDHTLEKFPYDLEKELVSDNCEVSILGFVEDYVGEKRTSYYPKLYFKNVGTDVDRCHISPHEDEKIRLTSIRAETNDGLDLSVYSRGYYNIGDHGNMLYPGDGVFGKLHYSANFELNHSDSVKRIVIKFSSGDTRYFEFKIIE